MYDWLRRARLFTSMALSMTAVMDFDANIKIVIPLPALLAGAFGVPKAFARTHIRLPCRGGRARRGRV